jgi:hypothetical protein
MEEEILRGEECLSLFSGIPCETMINFYSGQNILVQVVYPQEV